MAFTHIYCNNNNNNNNNKKYRENKISKKMKSNMKTLTIFIGHATHLYRAQKRNNKKKFFFFCKTTDYLSSKDKGRESEYKGGEGRENSLNFLPAPHNKRIYVLYRQ